jgi:hypothetical protein
MVAAAATMTMTAHQQQKKLLQRLLKLLVI